MDAEIEFIDPKELFHILLIDNISDEKLRSKLSSLYKTTEEIIKKARKHEKRKIIYIYILSKLLQIKNLDVN